jgi:DNA polymerase-1
MINIYNKLDEGGFKTKMLLQVHDELVFDVYKPELETIKSLIKEEMENAYALNVPLDVEMDTGVNWLEAH